MPEWMSVVLTILVYVLCISAILWLLVAVLQMARTLHDITDRLDDIERALFRRDK